MSPSDRVITFRPDVDVLDAMERYRERDGVPYSEQIRRALRAWLDDKGMMHHKRSATGEARALRSRYPKPVDQTVEKMNPRRRK
jgi:hypothetical protein